MCWGLPPFSWARVLLLLLALTVVSRAAAQTYVWTDGQEAALLLEWVERSGDLKGRALLARLVQDPSSRATPYRVRSESYALRGVRQGDRLALDLWGGTLVAQLEGSVLKMNLAGSDGRLFPITLKRGTARDYETATRKLSERAAAFNRAHQIKAGYEEAGWRLEREIKSLQNALKKLEDLTGRLEERVGDLEPFLKQLKDLWGELEKEDRQARAADCNDAEYIVNSTMGYTVNSEMDYVLNSSIDYVMGDVGDLYGAVLEAEQAVRGALRAAEVALTDFRARAREYPQSGVEAQNYAESVQVYLQVVQEELRRGEARGRAGVLKRQADGQKAEAQKMLREARGFLKAAQAWLAGKKCHSDNP